MQFNSNNHPKKHKLYLEEGAASKWNGTKKVKVTEIPLMNDCNCTIDCCYGLLILPNYNSNSGDSTPIAMYFVDGEPVYATPAVARAAIDAFTANALVSATSATMSGCLVGTPLIVAATRQLTATVLPSGSLQTGVWTTSNAGFATVSVGGLVTAVANGNVTITFTSTDGDFTATCLINVDAA